MSLKIQRTSAQPGRPQANIKPPIAQRPSVENAQWGNWKYSTVKAPPENTALPVNQYGNAAFVLVNPARPAGSFRFPNEPYHEYPVLPRDGLLVMYRSYTPHYQCPYQGEAPMVQVVCNIKLKRVSH